MSSPERGRRRFRPPEGVRALLSRLDASQEFSDTAFILGLKADVNNRSNVAVIHTGAEGSGPITLEFQVLDGSEGGKAVGQPLSVNLNPGDWAQPRGSLPAATSRTATSGSDGRPGRPPGTPTGSSTTAASPDSEPADGAYVPAVRP